MVWQRAGTVSVQNGSTTVTGTGLDFAASSRAGDSFVGPDGATYEVANVASATVISILPAYKGPTVSGGAYAIMPVQGYDKMLSDAFNALNNQFGPKLAALGTTGNYDILPVSKGGTGSSDQAGARTALGLGAVSVESIVPVAKGGSGSSTAAGARTNLGLGSSSTLNAGSIDGNVMLVGDRSSPLATTINVYGNSFQTWAASTAGAPETSTQGTMINAGYNSTNYGSQILMSFFGRMYFRSGTYASAIMREVYHTGNTTKAADGTLKAI